MVKIALYVIFLLCIVFELRVPSKIYGHPFSDANEEQFRPFNFQTSSRPLHIYTMHVLCNNNNSLPPPEPHHVRQFGRVIIARGKKSLIRFNGLLLTASLSPHFFLSTPFKFKFKASVCQIFNKLETIFRRLELKADGVS